MLEYVLQQICTSERQEQEQLTRKKTSVRSYKITSVEVLGIEEIWLAMEEDTLAVSPVPVTISLEIELCRILDLIERCEGVSSTRKKRKKKR